MQCSTSCGNGTETRVVRCEQKLSQSNIVEVDEAICVENALHKPDTHRPCEPLENCPPRTKSGKHRSSVITVEPYTFIQLLVTDKVSLSVGTTAILIEGTTIFIYCSVSGFNEKEIVWQHGNSTMSRKGRVKLMSATVLRIRMSRARTDAGVYTCIAGRDSANATISFHSVDDGLAMLQANEKYLPTPLDLDEEQKQDDYTSTRVQKGPYKTKYLQERTVPLHYVPAPWSPCSRRCGGAGIRSRDITCELMTLESMLLVDDKYCLKRYLEKPIETEDCGFGACPVWQTRNWTEVRLRKIFSFSFTNIYVKLSACSLLFYKS